MESERDQRGKTRRALIVQRVAADGFVTVADLAREFHVSEMTIRRDGEQLEQGGAITRVRGAFRTTGRPEHGVFDYSVRSNREPGAKQKLGLAAAALIEDKQVVAIDAGTTVFQTLVNLPQSFSGTIITHSIPAVDHLETRSHVRALVLGGELYRPTRSMVGSDAVRAALGLRADIFFLGAASIDERGIYGDGDTERDIKRALIEISDRTIVMVDQKKLTSSAPICICTWDDIDTLLTDGEPPTSLRGQLEAANVEIHVVS